MSAHTSIFRPLGGRPFLVSSCYSNSGNRSGKAVPSVSVVYRQHGGSATNSRPGLGSRNAGINRQDQRVVGNDDVDGCRSGRHMDAERANAEGRGSIRSINRHDDTTLVLNNVIVGEVWLCSGQSNMEMPLAGWPPNDTVMYSQGRNCAFVHFRIFACSRSEGRIPPDRNFRA